MTLLALLIAVSACAAQTDPIGEPAEQPDPTTTTTPAPDATLVPTTEAEPNDAPTPPPEPTASNASEPEQGNPRVTASDAFDQMMGWVTGDELTEAEFKSAFGAKFRDQVSYADASELFEKLSVSAPWAADEPKVTQSTISVAIRSGTDDQQVIQVQLTTDQGVISSLLFAPFSNFEPPVDVAAATARLEAFGQLRIAVFDEPNGLCSTPDGQGAAEPVPLGSIFKLYVLLAVQAEVSAGNLAWSDAVTISDELDSFPSGTTQDREDGSTLSVRELAELMISISDNTATDHLINLVGRDAVESAVVASGHSQPELLQPFLTTRELFVLKTALTQSQRDAYIASDLSAKREFLETTVASTPLTALADISWPDPIDIETVEWFGSTVDVCRAMTTLVSTAETREILTINPGVVSPAGQWQYIGFKGGSEPGVLAVVWRVESASSGTYVVVGSVFNPESVIDETEAINLFAAIRDFG